MALLAGANMSRSNFRSAKFNAADLERAKLDHSDLAHAEFTKANLRDATLFLADLSGTRFESAVLTRANVAYAKISPKTFVRRAKFGDEHDPHLDGSETVQFVRLRDRLLDWAKIRAIGTFPLFGAAYVSLALSLSVINGIGFLNHTKAIPSLNYPVPIPDRAVLIMASSLLLASGATLFKVCCPKTVQEYTETGWLQELGKSVLIYRVDRIQRWWAQILTLLLIITGGALAIYLIGEQLVRAVNNVYDFPIR